MLRFFSVALVGTLVENATGLRTPAATLGASANIACSSTPKISRRQLLPAALAAAALFPACTPAAIAADAPAGDCLGDCVRECNLVAPGNLGYCQVQCDDYCKDVGDAYGTSDVLRSDASTVAPTAAVSDCSRYKTDAAKAFCAKENKKASTPAPSPLAMNNGIFGDSGVMYSKGVEDLLASAFGATRQAKPLNDANVDEFAGEVFDKAKSAILGGN